MKLGRLQWALIIVATAVLVVMAPSDNESDAGKNRKSGNQSANSSASSRSKEAGHVDLERLARLKAQQKDTKLVGDVFNATSWYISPPKKRYVPPPPPPPPPPQVIAPPAAPPVPFTYLGRYGDSASRIIILSKGDRVYTVSVGDVIENTYRVEKLSAGMVWFVYLPLNAEQSLRTGDAL